MIYDNLLVIIASDAQFNRKMKGNELTESIRDVIIDYFADMSEEMAHEIAQTHPTLRKKIMNMTHKLSERIKSALQRQVFNDLLSKLAQ